MDRPCPYCDSPESEARYDRHGIYSGRSCDKCLTNLPGQGDMWDYENEEPLEED